MADIFLVPNWFFGYDVFLEAVFAVITLLVAIYSFKVYKLTDQRQPKIFGFGFILISISYIIKSLINYTILSQLNANICQVLKINNIVAFNNTGAFLYMLFFLAGLVTLAYMAMKIKNGKAYFLLLVTTIIALVYSLAKAYTFYLLASILLAIIIIHYFNNYMRRKQKKNLLVLLAFCFLLFGSVHFLVSVNHALFYVIGHFLELIAYVLILTNLLLLMKK